MPSRPSLRASLVAIVRLGAWIAASQSHQAPCHRLHSSFSAHDTYVCGDRGRCDKCPDNQYWLATKPRIATSATTAPARPSPIPLTP
jgi:hypothetical protein